jgi:hypothetical protein
MDKMLEHLLANWEQMRAKVKAIQENIEASKGWPRRDKGQP